MSCPTNPKYDADTGIGPISNAKQQVENLNMSIRRALQEYASKTVKLDMSNGAYCVTRCKQVERTPKWDASASFAPVETGRLKRVAFVEIFTDKLGDEAKVETLTKLLEAVEEEVKSVKSDEAISA